jgi:hypothetical protein
VNGALISGGNAVDVQQVGGVNPTTFQAVNRVGSFSNMALTPSFNIR